MIFHIDGDIEPISHSAQCGNIFNERLVLSTCSLRCHDNEGIDESPLCKDLKVDLSFFETMTFIFITPVNEIKTYLFKFSS